MSRVNQCSTGRCQAQIKWEDIKPALVRKVGSGGFAQVYEVYMYGALMAVKIVNLTADKDLNLSEALMRPSSASSTHKTSNHCSAIAVQPMSVMPILGPFIATAHLSLYTAAIAQPLNHSSIDRQSVPPALGRA